jgi:hypothetical protein
MWGLLIETSLSFGQTAAGSTVLIVGLPSWHQEVNRTAGNGKEIFIPW